MAEIDSQSANRFSSTSTFIDDPLKTLVYVDVQVDLSLKHASSHGP